MFKMHFFSFSAHESSPSLVTMCRVKQSAGIMNALVFANLDVHVCLIIPQIINFQPVKVSPPQSLHPAMIQDPGNSRELLIEGKYQVT